MSINILSTCFVLLLLCSHVYVVHSFRIKSNICTPTSTNFFDPFLYASNSQMLHDKHVGSTSAISRINFPVALISSALLNPSVSFASEDLPAQTLIAANTIRPALDSFITVMNLLFLCRTVLSWYPKTDIKRFPYSLISWPTEPFMQAARSIVPPAFGVDISAIVWIMLLSFVKEVFTGQQGIMTLIEKA